MREKNGQKLNDNSVFGPTITEKELKNGKKAKISFVLAILNSLVWLTLLIPANSIYGSIGTWVVAGYYMFLIGLIINSLTIVFGIFGIKSPKKNLAIASIILTIVPFLLLLIIVPLSLTHS